MNEQVYNGINNSLVSGSVLQSGHDFEHFSVSPRSDAGSPNIQRKISIGLLKSYDDERNE